MTLFWQVTCDAMIFKKCMWWWPLQIGVNHSSEEKNNINQYQKPLDNCFDYKIKTQTKDEIKH